MKKVLNTLFVIAAASVALASCQREGDLASEGTTVRFIASSEATRTAFSTPDATGSYPVLWTSQDEKIKVALNFGSAVDAVVTPAADGASAKFEATFKTEGVQTPYTFYALSPQTAYVSNNDKNMDWGFQILADQTPGAGTPDEAAQVLAGVSAAHASLDEVISVNFSHLTAYGRMTLRNLDLGGAEVTGVSLTAAVPLAGRFFYYVADTEDHTAGDIVVHTGSNTLNLKTSELSDLWFACAPADLSGTELKVTVATTDGPYVKTITLPAGRKFESGKIAKFTIDMTGAQKQESKVYELVTDAAQLTAGSEVIIANEAGDQAVSTTQNSNNRAATAVTVAGGKITDPSESVEIFVVEAGTTAGTFAFKASAGYLTATGTDSNQLRSEAEKSAAGSFAVSVSAEGVATVNAASASRGNMRYNENNNKPIFNCYAPSSTFGTPVALYKLVGSGSDTPMFQAVLEGANESGILEVGATETSATLSVIANVDWIVSGDGVTFSQEEGNSSAAVEITFPANETDQVKTYTINLESDLGEFEFVIKQAAKAVVGESLYKKVTTVTSGKKYIIAAFVDGKVQAMTPIASDKTYGYPAATQVSETDGVIDTRHEDLEFALETTTGGYTIKQADGRYWAMSGTHNNVNVYSSLQESYVWTVTANADGTVDITNVEKAKHIMYDGGHSNFAVYAEFGNSNTWPALYEYIEDGGDTPVDPPVEEGTVTFDFASMGLENGVQYSDPFTSGSYSVTFTGGGNDGKYYDTGTGIRTYGDGSIVVAGPGITGIVYTFSGSSYAPETDKYTISTGSFTPGVTSTWTGNADEVTLTRSTGSGHWRLQKVVVTYGDGGTTPVVETVATPTFSPAAGAVDAGTVVTISCATSGATIHYTTDGSTPTASSATGTSVTVNAAMTLKAIAVKSGMTDSAVATAEYTIKTVTPPSGDGWTLVTSASDLAAGDQIIIVCESKEAVATPITGSNKYLSSGDVTISNHTIADAGSAEVFTLGKSGDNWTLTNAEGKALGAKAAKSLAYGDGTTTWTIAIDSDGLATIASTENTYGRILYNAGSPRFMNYTSDTNASMLLPQIYKN